MIARTTTLLFLGLFCLAALTGCDVLDNKAHTTVQMQNSGMVYILPGIQGPDGHYQHVRNGLVSAGLRCAIKIHPWGCDIPGINLWVNETDTRSARQWATTIAKEIVEYQKQYPGRPVFIIGQSGGGTVAVFTAEAMRNTPGAKPISGVIMLDASLSSDYNMRPALSMTTEGILNFFYTKDTALLVVGTEIMGNIDGGHGSSAGQAGLTCRLPKLYQVRITTDMVNRFDDPHFADCTTAFATQYIAPWIFARAWPPSHTRMHE